MLTLSFSLNKVWGFLVRLWRLFASCRSALSNGLSLYSITLVFLFSDAQQLAALSLFSCHSWCLLLPQPSNTYCFSLLQMTAKITKQRSTARCRSLRKRKWVRQRESERLPSGDRITTTNQNVKMCSSSSCIWVFLQLLLITRVLIVSFPFFDSSSYRGRSFQFIRTSTHACMLLVFPHFLLCF